MTNLETNLLALLLRGSLGGPETGNFYLTNYSNIDLLAHSFWAQKLNLFVSFLVQNPKHTVLGQKVVREHQFLNQEMLCNIN